MKQTKNEVLFQGERSKNMDHFIYFNDYLYFKREECNKGSILIFSPKYVNGETLVSELTYRTDHTEIESLDNTIYSSESRLK